MKKIENFKLKSVFSFLFHPYIEIIKKSPYPIAIKQTIVPIIPGIFE